MDLNLITSADYLRLTAGKTQGMANLKPQLVAILAEPNTSHANDIDTTPFQPVTRGEVINRMGAGSPADLMFRYFERSTVPVVIFPQAYGTAPAPTATQHEITVSGTATEATQIIMTIASREFALDIAKGSTAAEVAQLISDVAGAPTSSPVTGSANGVIATLTTKWKGATSAALKTTFKPAPNTTMAGLTFTNVITLGTGTPDIAPALAEIEGKPFTLIVNPYGEAKFAELENLIGYPSDILNVGLWGADVAEPCLAVSGSLVNDLASAKLLTDTEARKTQPANTVIAAPGTEWFPFEAAASGASMFAQVANSQPHRGIIGLSLPHCPPPVNGVGDFATIGGRDAIAKAGHSTAEWVNGRMVVTDFVTTFHPDGVPDPKFRNSRDVMVMINIMYALKHLQESYRGLVVTAEDTPVLAPNVITTAAVRADFGALLWDLGKAALIATPANSEENMSVSINPARRINMSAPAELTSEIKQTNATVGVTYFVSI